MMDASGYGAEALAATGDQVAERGAEPSASPRQPDGNWRWDWPSLTDVLIRADVRGVELLWSAFNQVFVLTLDDAEAGRGVAVYKPRRGEARLAEYPDGTLYRRERAAYVLSGALGWGIVPPTVIREGPEGVGMVQLHVDHRPRQNYFTLREQQQGDLRRMAAFDVIANNGDRKGRHCLLDHDGRVWGIDHGLTFHARRMLCTVIWDFVGEPVPSELLGDVVQFLCKLERHDPSVAELEELLERGERRALRQRAEHVLAGRVYPDRPSGRSVPWPAL
jgi:hypothetical protein